MSPERSHYHFMGIGGIGMSALALLLHDRGHPVSGCDRSDSELLNHLRTQHIDIQIGHDANHLQTGDVLVYTSAIPASHPERLAAQVLGVEQIRRADMLGTIAREYTHCLAVAGTHGKTTTTGILGLILEASAVDPTVFVGGILPQFAGNLRLGDQSYLAVEADEYDRSFLTLHPQAAIVTSLEADHLDIYDDLADLKATFRQFLSQVEAAGPILLCGEAPELIEIADGLGRKIWSYGRNPEADYRVVSVVPDGFHTQFELELPQGDRIKVNLGVPGEHNVLNATAALALCHRLQIDLVPGVEALKHFHGVERRFELRGQRRGVLFLDDYAHHPTEVAATLRMAREHFPEQRIFVIFQPHLYSRTRDFAAEFAEVLDLADTTILAPLYPAREAPIPGVGSALIREKWPARSTHAPVLAESRAAIPGLIEPLLEGGDLVITMGAGDIWEINDQILAEGSIRG